jgi:hypothetical protein
VEWGRLGPSAKKNHRCCVRLVLAIRVTDRAHCAEIRVAYPRSGSLVFRFCRVCLITGRVCDMLRPFVLLTRPIQLAPRFSRPCISAPGLRPPRHKLIENSWPMPFVIMASDCCCNFPRIKPPAVDEACQAMSWSNGIYLATIGVCQWSPSTLCQVAEIPQHGARKRVHIRAFSGRTETFRFMGMSH